MSNQTPEAAAQHAQSIQPDNWLQNAPGGDIPFEQLFNEGAPQSSQTTAQSTTVPQTPPTPTEFLRTSKSVYKTADEAQRGVEEKDSLIEQLRTQLAQIRGVDPITNRPVASPQEDVNYAQNPQKFYEDLEAKARAGDKAGYAQVNAKFIADYLAPVTPVFRDFAKTNATEELSREYKDFRDFRNSPEFDKVLGANPVLKTGIEGAESDFRFHNQLPGLYKLAYSAYVAMRVPEMLKSAQTAAQPAPTPTRPTLTQPQTPTPGASPVTALDTTQMLHDTEARGEYLKRMAHMRDLPWKGVI